MLLRKALSDVAFLLLLVVVLGLVGCGDNGDKGRPTAGAPLGTAPPGGTPMVATPQPQLVTLAVITRDYVYDTTNLQMERGREFSLTLTNRGSATHSWHLLGVRSRDGREVATRHVPGGESDTIRFIIDTPGQYDYQCDIHPAEMRGKLTVQ